MQFSSVLSQTAMIVKRPVKAFENHGLNFRQDTHAESWPRFQMLDWPSRKVFVKYSAPSVLLVASDFQQAVRSQLGLLLCFC